MFEQDFENMLRSHRNAVQDKRMFKGLAKDYFPEDTKTLNLLLIAYDLGIAEEMENVSAIDNTFAFKYVKKLMDSYGISRKNADWIVSVWCVSYGEKVLGKANDIQVQQKNQGPAITEQKDTSTKLYGDNFAYTNPSNNCVGISGFSGEETSTVILPNKYSIYDVNHMEYGAFAGSDIEEVVVTEGYRGVGKEVFNGCSRLHQAILPESIRDIEDMAFKNCISLKTITLPSMLETIGNSAFENAGLKTVKIPQYVYSIGTAAFRGCFDLNNIDIPNNIKRITKEMFKNCTSLKKLKLSAQLEAIEDEAFMGCSSLDFVIIPDNVKEIGENAFAGTDKQFIIQCSFGSYAEQYCRKNKIKYQLV